MTVTHTGVDESEPVLSPAREHRFRWLAVPLGIWAASRVIQLVLLDWMLKPGTSLYDKLLIWDAVFFVEIGEKGYDPGYRYDADGEVQGSTLAFFPGYPLLIRLAHAVTRLDHAALAITIAWIAGAVTAVLLFALARDLWDGRVAACLTALLCVQPMAIALSLAYSEPVFLAFAVGTLLAAYRRHWVVAAVLGLAASLTRPTGAAIGIALLAAAVLHVRRPEHGPRRWWVLLSALPALCGVPAYLIWVAVRVGEPGAYFRMQTTGWGTSFDFGANVLTFLRNSLQAAEGWVQLSVAWLLVATLVVVAIAVRQAMDRRIWLPLVVYGLVAYALVVGQAGYYHSKPRLLVPVLLTLVPPALALGRARPATAAAVITGSGLFGLWYGAYLATVWPYAI